MRRASSGFVVLVIIALGTAAAARNSLRSPEAARQLVELMQAQNMDAFAAEDPLQPRRFVAAMLVPDVQLLVVVAESTAAEYLRSQLSQRDYRDVYLTLHSSAVPRTKLFIQDMACDGLNDRGGNLDIIYAQASTQTVFDGDWRAQNLTKGAYEEKLQNADRSYADALALLVRALADGEDAGESGHGRALPRPGRTPAE
jgi:hypothetical protein